jgi:hypothetical protein
MSSSAFAQGSIFGSVNNSDMSTPANGEISFFGFLDDTDEEIRIETSDGAGYDAGNWYDDFQNYLTEGPGNPYDYYFYNSVNAEGFHLAKLIPNNSFQQENIVLAPSGWPVQPTGLTGSAVSSTSVVLAWNGIPGLTYHVYRRAAASNGSLFRLDNVLGDLANPGVADSFYVDMTVDGVSSYDYMIIAQDSSGNFSPHSALITVNSASLAAPVLVSIDPTHGPDIGGTLVNVYGSEFDAGGVSVQFGTAGPVVGTVLSPFHVTATTPPGVATTSVDVTVTNTASGLPSNTLVGAYTYDANQPPVLDPINDTSVIEGDTLLMVVTASDPDGTTPALSVINEPANVIFTDSGNGTGTFFFTPDYTQAGPYAVTFIADDGIAADSQDVLITVNEAGNQYPVLDPIADTSVAEGDSLIFTVTATDPDGPPPTLSAINLPNNATFDPGTGVFDFRPDMTQEGVDTVTFIASDGSLADSQAVVITVTGVNQVPVLDPIPDTTMTEGDSLLLIITASDADGVIPVLSAVNVPENAVFTDSGNGVGTFIFTPNYVQAAGYTVTFIADDGVAADSQDVLITVNEAGDQPPVFTPVNDTTIAEGDTLILLISAVDPDGLIPTLTAENVPTNASFADSGDGTGIFQFAPDYLQSGPYTVSFIADDGTLVDTMDVTVTVADLGNLAPVFDTIPDTTINEGEVLVLNVSATDPDGGGAIPSLSISTNLPNYTFVDSGNGTGTFTYSPDYFSAEAAASSATVTFFATDQGTPQRTGVEYVEVITMDVNQPPVWDSVGQLGATIGDTLVYTISATDVTDPDTTHRLQLSVVNPPAHLTFTDHGDNSGTLRFAPDSSQLGGVTANFLAVDQGSPQLSANTYVDINVVTVNLAPVFSIPPDQQQIVTEGGSLTYTVTASDPDGGIPAISAVNLPDNSSFDLSPTALDTGVFTFSPDFTQGGHDDHASLYYVEFRAFDGFVVSKKVVLFQVNDAGNQAPIFDAVGSYVVTEGDSIVATATASDPDLDPVTISVAESTPLPYNAVFTDSGGGLATIEFFPDYTQQGQWDFEIIATDGSLDDTTTISITVDDAGPQPPSLDTIPDWAITEGDTLVFTVTTTDVDAVDSATYPFLSVDVLPGSASFTDNRDGTGEFYWETSFTDSGTYDIWFYATDAVDPLLVDSQIVEILVADSNRTPRGIYYLVDPDPIINKDTSAKVFEGDTITYWFQGFDDDGPAPTFDANLDEQDTLAPNMILVDSGNGVGTFSFYPDYTQGTLGDGTSYYVNIYAVDSVDPTLRFLFAKKLHMIIINANQPPVMSFRDIDSTEWVDSIGPYTIPEGDSVVFIVWGEDFDSTPLPTVTAFFLPIGATFTGTIDTKTFRFYPDFTQAGAYTVGFVVTDIGGAVDTQYVDITVTEAGPQPPVFTSGPGSSTTVPVGAGLEMPVVVADPDRDSVVLTVEPELDGATFTDHGDGTGTYVYTPDVSVVGNSYQLFFIATDAAGMADTVSTMITVVSFLRGDVDLNNRYTMNDLADLISYVYRDGPEPQIMETADVNGDGLVNLIDITYLIRFLYHRGPAPPQ